MRESRWKAWLVSSLGGAVTVAGESSKKKKFGAWRGSDDDFWWVENYPTKAAWCLVYVAEVMDKAAVFAQKKNK